MKKILLFVIVSLMTAITAKADNYYESPKIVDNVYLEALGVVTTPLDFNKVFPLNSGFGLKLGKDFSPIFGMNVEGTIYLGDNHWTQQTDLTFKAVNVGVNGTVNLSNLLLQVSHSHPFNVTAEFGLGWLHFFGHENIQHNSPSSVLSAKTGLNFGIFIGKGNVWELDVNPFVAWNLTNTGINNTAANQFNKNKAQLGLAVGMRYYFQNSYGKRGFNYIDIDNAMNQINSLKEQLQQAKDKPAKVVSVTETKIVEKSRAGVITVAFDINSAELTDEAKNALNQIVRGTAVEVEGYASEDGSIATNDAIALKRAEAVTEYLKVHGAIVRKTTGFGANGKAKQRVVFVVVK